MTASPTARTRIVVTAIAIAIAIEGLASARIGYASFEFRHAVLVLATGWVVAACGLAAWLRVPSSRTGPLLVLVAATWYLAGFRWVAYPPAADLFTTLSLLYSAVTAHALLSYPSGRVVSVPVWVAVLACYAASLLPLPRADVAVAIPLLLGLGFVAVRDRRDWGERRTAILGGLVFGLVLASHRLVPGWIEGAAWIDARPALMLALGGVAIVLTVPLLRSARSLARLADVVVELGESPRADLVRELGELVGDPDVQLGVALPGDTGYVDARGSPVELPQPRSGRVATPLGHGDRVVGVIVHATSTELDPGILEALARAAALTVSNARLQADVQAQVRAVRASRLRLLVAGDEERLALERRLGEALGPRIDALEASLTAPGLSAEVAAPSALEQLHDTRRELVALIDGIGPPIIDDRSVGAALEDLASHATLPLEVRVDGAGPPSRVIRSTLLFVAREAVANITKHAGASLASIHLDTQAGEARIEISDDGRGGADSARGTGLQGLRDRVEALGGRLTIESRPGRGTRITASLPLEEPTW